MLYDEEYKIIKERTFNAYMIKIIKNVYLRFMENSKSGSGSGIIQIQKPDGSYYQDFVEFNGDTSVTKRVYLASQGTYIIEVALSGSANVTVTVTN